MSGWRPHLESAICLDLIRLLKLGQLLPGRVTSGVLVWSNEWERVASVGFHADLRDECGTLTLRYLANGKPAEDVIELSTVPNHFGGRNWFMHCPVTGRRARKLYKWSELRSFCHREAVRPRPTYASQRDSGTDRINRQRWALRQKMGDRFSDLFGEPFKPKRMRWVTYDRYAARDVELEGREAPM